MVQTFLLLNFDTITNEKTVKFMQRDIITSTITWHLGLVGSNNFGEYTSFSPFTLVVPSPGVRVAVAEPLIRDLGRVSEWCDLCGMKLNASKTKTRGLAQCIPSHPH